MQLEANEDVDGNSGLPAAQTTAVLHQGPYGSLKNFDRTMYSPDIEDQALIMETGSASRVQYNALRQPYRPSAVINRHKPTTKKATPLLGSRCHVLENSTELTSFIGIYPLSGITYKLNSREIKPQKPSRQPLGALESDLRPQFNLRPMMCHSAKSSTGNRNNAQLHRNLNPTNSLKVEDALKLQGDGNVDKTEVETKLFHVKIRASSDDAAFDKLSRYHQCSAQTVRCTHTREQLKTILQRPATSTFPRTTLSKKNASFQGSRHNAVVHQKVTKNQEIDCHRQDDKPNTEGTQLEHTMTNCEERLADSVFPETSAAVGILRNSCQSVAPLPPSPVIAIVNTLSSARPVSRDADKIKDRSTRVWKGKIENENTTWLRAVKHSKSPNQRRKARPVTTPTTKRFGNGDERQSAFAKSRSVASDEDELSTDNSEDLVDGGNDVILRQTLLKQREARNAAENSEEEKQERNERICEWLLGLNYSDQERPPSPVIVEETPMQTDTAIHIVYNGN